MIKIPIVSTFNSKGFKQADKATTMLAGKFKGLALSLGAALSVRRITQFSKAAVKAFAEDNRAASALAQTMNNLGMAFQSPAVEDFISRLSKTAAVADDVLRPALGDLLRATRNLGKAQEILNLGLDISAATGKDLRTVTTALSRAYLGNNTSLGRLNAGLSKAFIASASFEEIQSKLEQMFSGSAQKAAGSYAGQLDKLRIASEEAKEMIGKSLVQSIEILGNQNGIDLATKKMEGFGRATSDVVLGFSYLVKQTSGGADGKKGLFGNFIELIGDLTRVNQLLADTRTLAAQARQELLEPVQRQSIRAIENEAKAAQARWLKEQRALDKIRKKQEKIAKASKAAREEAERRRKILEKLAQAGDILDTEKASIEAALKNESLSENELLRLRLKKAILNENADRALELSNQLAKSQDEMAKLAAIKFTNNPFDAWLETLRKISEGLNSLATAPSGRIVSPDLQDISKGTPYTPTDPGFRFEMPQWDWGASGGGILPMPTSNGVVVNMNISNLNGDLPQQVKDQIVQTVVEASGAGMATGWYRTTNRVAI